MHDDSRLPNSQCLTRKQLLTIACELAQAHGDILTFAIVCGQTGLSRERINLLCNSWSELRTAIGLAPHRTHSRQTLSREALLDKLRAAIAERGENLRQTEFCKLIGYSITLLSDRYGSWANLRKAVGLTLRTKREILYSDQAIFDDMCQVVSRIHCKPTYHGYKREGGLISSLTIWRRFGSWKKAIYAYEDELDRRCPEQPQPRFREDPHNPRAFFVFQYGKPLYYIEYDSSDFTTSKKTPLPPDFML